jgi:hypothetical protein
MTAGGDGVGGDGVAGLGGDGLGGDGVGGDGVAGLGGAVTDICEWYRYVSAGLDGEIECCTGEVTAPPAGTIYMESHGFFCVGSGYFV